MIFDDENPKTKKSAPRVLDTMSIAELRAYVDELKEEIARVEADIEKKEKHKAAMEGLFRS